MNKDRRYREIFYITIFIGLTIAAALIAFYEQKRMESVLSPLSPMAASSPTPRPTPDVPGNLLVNPSFEGQFVNCGESCNVAPGWRAWTSETLTPPCIGGEPGCYIPCPSNCDDCRKDYGCYWSKAEHSEITTQYPERVHSGERAQKIFTFGRMGMFGVRQSVSVIPGTDYLLSGYLQGWQTCWPAQANDCPQAKMNLRLGIDPFGGIDPYSLDIVWSDTVESFNAYKLVTVTARTWANTVTVFTYARPEWDWARMSNDAYIDDLSLVAISPTPTPEPTETPSPPPTQGPVVAIEYLPCIFRNWQEEPKPTYTPTPTPVYTNNTLLLLPPYSAIRQGESITISVHVKAAFQAIELRLFYSPTVLISKVVTSTLPCSIVSLRQQPGVVAYDCEMDSQIGIDRDVLQMSFTGNMTGTARVETYVNGAFIGLWNGYGLVLATDPAIVEVR